MKQPTAKETIAKNVRGLREHHGWTQEHLAKVANVSQSTVSNIENNKNATYSPTMDNIEAISKAFGLAPYHLIMPLPIEELVNHCIEKVIECYTQTDKTGRENIARIAEMAVRSHQDPKIKAG